MPRLEIIPRGTGYLVKCVYDEACSCEGYLPTANLSQALDYALDVFKEDFEPAQADSIEQTEHNHGEER